jgi:hypothetical protein
MIEQLDAEPPEVRRFLADLAELGDGTLPAPSPALAALLEGAEAPATSRDSDRTGGVAVAGVALLLAVGTGWAAAANELPAPLQDAIADFSHHHLPFDLPYSTDRDGQGDPGPGAVTYGLSGERSTSRGYRVRTAADIDDLLADQRAELSVGGTAGEPLGEIQDDAASPVQDPEQSADDDAVTGVPLSEPGSAGDGAAGSSGDDQSDDQSDDRSDDQSGSQGGSQSGNTGTHPGGGAGGNAGSNPGGAPDDTPGDDADDHADDTADDAADVGRPAEDDPSALRRPDRAEPPRDVPQRDGTARPPVT